MLNALTQNMNASMPPTPSTIFFDFHFLRTIVSPHIPAPTRAHRHTTAVTGTVSHTRTYVVAAATRNSLRACHVSDVYHL